MSLSCTVLTYSEIFVENHRIFNLPHLYLALPFGVTQLEFRRDLRVTGLLGHSNYVPCFRDLRVCRTVLV